MNVAKPLKVVVVGPCASGKTTLVEGLKRLGYDARVISQEHSIVQDLFSRTNPDVVIALRIDLATLRLRRGENWDGALYGRQLERLRTAYQRADAVIDTSKNNEATSLAMAVDAIVTVRNR